MHSDSRNGLSVADLALGRDVPGQELEIRGELQFVQLLGLGYERSVSA